MQNDIIFGEFDVEVFFFFFLKKDLKPSKIYQKIRFKVGQKTKISPKNTFFKSGYMVQL
jgi:hypothetical protein